MQGRGSVGVPVYITMRLFGATRGEFTGKRGAYMGFVAPNVHKSLATLAKTRQGINLYLYCPGDFRP